MLKLVQGIKWTLALVAALFVSNVATELLLTTLRQHSH